MISEAAVNIPLPDDLADLQRRLLAFVADEIDPLTRGLDPEAPAPELRRAIAQRSEAAGFFRLSIPRADGGLGAGPLRLTAAREALACSGNPFASLALARGPGIMRLADNDAQRAALYAPILAGERSAAFGFTEAPGAQRTQAVPCTLEDGAPGFAVTGRKAFVSGGDSADWIVVVANVPPNTHAAAERGGTALLVVDRGAPGVEQGAVGASIDGSTHCPFTFSETPVPETRLLGKIGDGLPRALANIDQMRLAVAAQAVGAARWANRLTLERIEGPHRSGSPLAEREQVQAIFADAVAETYQARAALYCAAEALELGRAGAGTETAIAKSAATEMLGRVVDRAIQLHGAQALLRGHPLERMLRVARSLRIAEGPTELLRLTIARQIRAAGAEAL